MANNDAAGAEAATRYFVALADYSLSTLDMRQWELLTDDDCVFCDGISETVREAQAGNLARAGGELAVTLINNVEFRGDSNLFLVDAEIHQEAYTWKTGDGLVVEEAAASGRTLSFALQHSELGWRLLAAGTSEG